MKKIGLTVVVLVLILIIYYISTGSKQITQEIRKEVHKELVELQSSGFGVDEQNLSDNKEHIVITFKDTDKITQYLNKQGQSINRTDTEILKGMQIGLDIEYMPTAKNAMAMDIYPLKLPESFYQDITSKEDRELIAELEKMIKERIFLTHININKLLSGFDGYVKDIDRVFDNNKSKAHLVSRGLKFNGSIENEEIKNIHQKLDIMSFKIDKQLDINLSNLNSNIKTENRNFIYDYTIQSVDIKSDTEELLALSIDNIKGNSEDILKGELLNTSSKIEIQSIDLKENNKESILKDITIDSSLKNINKKAIEKLEEISSIDEIDDNTSNQIILLLKEIAKDDISLEIKEISVAKITNDGKTFNGFKINASAKIEKNFDWKKLDSDPFGIIEALNAKVHIEASNELVDIVSSNPQAMVMMMVIQPVEQNGTKNYDIEFKKGTLKINGKPFM
jgi:Na+-transporting methylmalonyl-CoA/oxaloacetate decarboxylase gamma subunit